MFETVLVSINNSHDFRKYDLHNLRSYNAANGTLTI